MYFVNPSIDIKSSETCLVLAQNHPEVFTAIGIHPNDIDEFSQTDVKSLGSYLPNNKVVAIGEIGLDFYHKVTDRDLQIKIFIQQLELANNSNLPVIIHSREALNDVIDLLKFYYGKSQNFRLNGVIHSFEGTVADACEVIKLGFVIGIGGPITYKNSQLKQSLVRELPLTSIILETDSPFLSPAPLRGTRNEPANIKIIAQKIANLKECDIKQVETQTTNNALALFRIGEEIDLN
jgi:TatD DNase family protein